MGNILHLATSLGILAVAWGSVGEAQVSSEQPFHYHYVSLDAAVPPGFDRFIPIKITDSGSVYGNLVEEGCPSFSCLSTGIFKNGAMRVISDDLLLHCANERGVLGGGVVIDDANGFEQAALIEHGKLKRLRKLKGEVSSYVHLITESGLALVKSFQGEDTGFRLDYYYYSRGQIIPLPLLSNLDAQGMNNRGLIAGIRPGPELDDYRAFRFKPPANLALLNPVPPYASSRAFGIDDRGDVVSLEDGPFVSGEPAVQQVGFWRGQKFATYFVQGGTTRFPERTQTMVANEQGLIVAGPDFVFGTAFILPRPDLRIPLAEITDEKIFQLWFPADVNSRGDIIGFTAAHDGTFRTSSGLFQRADRHGTPLDVAPSGASTH